MELIKFNCPSKRQRVPFCAGSQIFCCQITCETNMNSLMCTNGCHKPFSWKIETML